MGHALTTLAMDEEALDKAAPLRVLSRKAALNAAPMGGMALGHTAPAGALDRTLPTTLP